MQNITLASDCGSVRYNGGVVSGTSAIYMQGSMLSVKIPVCAYSMQARIYIQEYVP